MMPRQRTLPTETRGGRGTGRWPSRDDWERRYPDRPYMTDDEGYAIDSRSDAGGPSRGQNPRLSTEISANERKRQAALEGASQHQTPNTASMTSSSRRNLRARKTLLTQNA